MPEGLCIHKDRDCREACCDGLGRNFGDDKCYLFTTDPNHCSLMNAVCYKANSCYGELREVTETECSLGMVLCTDVDNPDNRYMYDKEDLIERPKRNIDGPTCPDDVGECTECVNYQLCAFLGYL